VVSVPEQATAAAGWQRRAETLAEAWERHRECCPGAAEAALAAAPRPPEPAALLALLAELEEASEGERDDSPWHWATRRLRAALGLPAAGGER
jgi:hypothetical protein